MCNCCGKNNDDGFTPDSWERGKKCANCGGLTHRSHDICPSCGAMSCLMKVAMRRMRKQVYKAGGFGGTKFYSYWQWRYTDREKVHNTDITGEETSMIFSGWKKCEYKGV